MSDIKVGDTYFIFDENTRVYERGKNRGPIYREHFIPVKITDETSRSWIYGPDNIKVKKSNPWLILKTNKMVDDAVWVHENAYRISEQVRHCDFEQLQKVAEIIGYKKVNHDQ